MTVQPKPETQGTRSRLLDAARYLFWEKGYAATGMAELLERAQANSGSFYHFFAGKEALLLAVLEGYLEGLDPVVIQPAFARHRDPIERVFEILNFYRGNLTKAKFGCGCLLDVRLLFGSATFCMTGVTSPGTKFLALLLRTVSSTLSLVLKKR